MNLRNLFYLNAILLISGSLALILAPAIVLERQGFTTDNPEFLQLASNSGGFMLSIGLVAWFAARAVDSPFRRQVRLAFFILHLTFVLIHAGVWLFSGVAFSIVIPVHLTLALAFGYFQFVKPDAD